MTEHDSEIMVSLNSMREARDASVRLRNSITDEAKLARVRADMLDEQAVMMTDEINEDVPIGSGS